MDVWKYIPISEDAASLLGQEHILPSGDALCFPVPSSLNWTKSQNVAWSNPGISLLGNALGSCS